MTKSRVIVPHRVKDTSNMNRGTFSRLGMMDNVLLHDTDHVFHRQECPISNTMVNSEETFYT